MSAQYDITIPEGLPKLDGSFTRQQRVEVALDVIATLKSRQRKFVLAPTYFETEHSLPDRGQLNSSRIKGRCFVCARGMLFIKSLDRFNSFDLETDSIDPVERTEDEWGYHQAKLIEDCFEGTGDGSYFFESHGRWFDRKGVLTAICENIVANHGELIP